MRKSQWVEEKLLVLISIRDLYNTIETRDNTETGDIIALIDTGLYGKMKKIPGINPLLFVDDRMKAKALDGDDIFDRGELSESDSEEDEDENAKRKEKAKAREAEINARRTAKYGDTNEGGVPPAVIDEDAEDVNIDDI